LDSSILVDYFRNNNYVIVNSPRRADYILVSTCAFNKNAEDVSFKLIEKHKKYKGELIVIGCLPEIDPARFRKRFNGRYLVTKDLDRLDSFFPENQVKLSGLPDSNEPFPIISRIDKFFLKFRLSREFSFKCLLALKNFTKNPFAPLNPLASGGVYIRISYGCSRNCSYCRIRNAIGPLKSKPMKTCLEEYGTLLSRGHRNFVLTADNLGIYGADISSSLPELLNEMSRLDKGLLTKWTLLEIQPDSLVEYKTDLITFIKEGKISTISSPLQSGSPRILRLMSRYSNIDNIVNTLNELKGANASIKLLTDLIVGFPGETEEDFNLSLEVTRNALVDKVHLFAFAEWENTAAIALPNRIDQNVILRRLKHATTYFGKNNIEVVYV